MSCTSFVQPCSPQHFSLPSLCVSAALAVVSNIFIRERLFPHIGSMQDPSLLTLVRAHPVCSYALVTPQFHDVIPTLCVSRSCRCQQHFHSRAFVRSHWFEARSVIAHSCACAPSLLLRSSHPTTSRCLCGSVCLVHTCHHMCQNPCDDFLRDASIP